MLKYLRANGYKTRIVTGGGQNFVRAYSESVYGVPPERVVGSAFGTSYGYDREAKSGWTVVSMKSDWKQVFPAAQPADGAAAKKLQSWDLTH